MMRTEHTLCVTTHINIKSCSTTVKTLALVQCLEVLNFIFKESKTHIRMPAGQVNKGLLAQLVLCALDFLQSLEGCQFNLLMLFNLNFEII